MKKLITIVAVAVTGFASFGQGFFSFTGNTKTAWDDFTSTPRLAASLNVGFLWGASGTALITGLANNVPTNSVSLPNSLTPAQAWTAITTDPNYTVAVNNGSSAVVVQPTLSNGSWQYNSSGTFGVTGTSVGTTYTVIVFGWSSAYANPGAALGANSPVGWSAPFSYTAVSSIGTPATMAASGLVPFGVATAVPEPATIALAGLGGLSLLALRRKK